MVSVLEVVEVLLAVSRHGATKMNTEGKVAMASLVEGLHPENH